MTDIGRSGELWAHVVKLESSNTERTTGRCTPAAQIPVHTTKAIHAIVTTKSSLGSTTGTRSKS